MFNMLQQIKDMKSKISDFKKVIENATFFGKSSDGEVQVKVSGKAILLNVDISENLSNRNNLNLSILEAYKNAKSEADDFYNNEMNKVTGGMQLPFDLKSFL